MIRRDATVVAMLLAVAAGATAFGLVQRGILHPEMSPNQGSYSQPQGTIGATPSAPWTGTTVEASVNGHPNVGRQVSEVGEIIDYSCYMQLGKHGAKHRDCGIKCVQNGEPIGLLTRSGGIFILMPEEHHPRRDGQTNFTASVGEHMGDIVRVTGTETEVGRQRAIFVQGFTAPLQP